jgi:hypothetical protein
MTTNTRWQESRQIEIFELSLEKYTISNPPPKNIAEE